MHYFPLYLVTRVMGRKSVGFSYNNKLRKSKIWKQKMTQWLERGIWATVTRTMVSPNVELRGQDHNNTRH